MDSPFPAPRRECSIEAQICFYSITTAFPQFAAHVDTAKSPRHASSSQRTRETDYYFRSETSRSPNIKVNIQEVVVADLPEATTTSEKRVDATKSDWASPPTQPQQPYADIANCSSLNQHTDNIVEEGLRGKAPSSCEISFTAARSITATRELRASQISLPKFFPRTLTSLTSIKPSLLKSHSELQFTDKTVLP